MSYYGGFRGRGNRMPPPSGSRFGLAPLTRPASSFRGRGGFRGGGFRGHRPLLHRGGHRIPGRGEVIRMGPSRPPPQIKKEDNQSNSGKVNRNEIKKEETSNLDDKKTMEISKDQKKVEVHDKEERDVTIKSETEIKSESPRITLDKYNSELHVSFEDDDMTAFIMRGTGFEYMWGGVRATHGVSRGKVCFEVHLLENLKVDLPDEKNPCISRIGWSVDGSDYQLGEDKLSWGYGGTGKSAFDSKFFDYGKTFDSGDTVTCYIDLDATPKAIFYMVNGEYLGVAFRFTNELAGRAVYPHVACKNMKFCVNFGERSEKYPLTNGFKMIQKLSVDELVTPPPGASKPEEGEVIMMVGLPACGKSFWCENYASQHPDKKYYILGTNSIIDRMKVSGLTRKRNYHGRWEELIKRASAVLNKLFDVAKHRPKNYILDQTNVYFTARSRKMESFCGYKRIAAVLVNKPEVLKNRTEKQQKTEGKIVPHDAVMEMKRNFSLPEIGSSFDDVWFLEELKEPAHKYVEQYRREGEEFKKSVVQSPSIDKNHPEKKPRTDFPVTPNRGFQSTYSQRQNLMDVDTKMRTPNRQEESNRSERAVNKSYDSGSFGNDDRKEHRRSEVRDRSRDTERDRIHDRKDAKLDRGRLERGREPAHRDETGRDTFRREDRGIDSIRRDDRRVSSPRTDIRSDHAGRGIRDDRPVRRDDRPAYRNDYPPRDSAYRSDDSRRGSSSAYREPYRDDVKPVPRDDRFHMTRDGHEPVKDRFQDAPIRRAPSLYDGNQDRDYQRDAYDRYPVRDEISVHRVDRSLPKDAPPRFSDGQEGRQPPFDDYSQREDRDRRYEAPVTDYIRERSQQYEFREREPRQVGIHPSRYPSDRMEVVPRDREDSWERRKSDPYYDQSYERSESRLFDAPSYNQPTYDRNYPQHMKADDIGQGMDRRMKQEIDRPYSDARPSTYESQKVDRREAPAWGEREKPSSYFDRIDQQGTRPYDEHSVYDAQRDLSQPRNEYPREDMRYSKSHQHPPYGRGHESAVSSENRNWYSDRRSDVDQYDRKPFGEHRNQYSPTREQSSEGAPVIPETNYRPQHPFEDRYGGRPNSNRQGIDYYNDSQPRDDRQYLRGNNAYGEGNQRREFYNDPPPRVYEREPYREENRRYAQSNQMRYETEVPKPYPGMPSTSSLSGSSGYLYTSNSNQGKVKPNDQLSSSYHTQMTTSTANYSRPLHTLGALDRSQQQQANQSADNYSCNPSYSTQSSHERVGSQVLPPQGTATVTSYEKQQEDYQKAYSQWYANYAQAFAELAQKK